MRRVKGISETVAIALLIVVAIALAVAIYFATQRFTTTSDYVQVQAFKVQNKYAGTNQISIVGLRLIPKSDKYLTITQIVVFASFSDGSSAKTTIAAPAAGTAWNGQFAAGNPASIRSAISITGEGPTTINPGTTLELTFTFTNTIAGANANPQIVSLSFQVTVRDPSGALYTYTSNEVSVT